MIVAVLGRLRLFALREFTVHWRRSAASIAVIGVSAALLVAILGVFGSLTGSVDRLATQIAGKADLEVAGITDGGFDQSVQAELSQIPGVGAAVPMLRTQLRSGSEQIPILGVDPGITALKSGLQEAVQDLMASPEFFTVPKGVAVGAGMGLEKGRTLDLGTRTVPVVAVIDNAAARRINGGHFILAPLPLAQQVADRPHQLDSILVVAKPGNDLNQVRSDVTKVVAGRAVVAAPNFRTAQASSSIATLRYALLVAATIALVVAAFLVFNAMNMAVTARRPSISMLRALGGRRSAIVRDLLTEAAMLGMLGTTIGVPIGLLMGKWAIGRLPNFIVQSIDARLEYAPPPYAIPVAAIACVTASVVASALAARQVYGVAPIEALAPPGASPADRVSGRLRAIVATAALSAVLLAFLLAFHAPGRLAMAGVCVFFAASIGLCFAFTGPIVNSVARVSRIFGAPGRLGAESVERAPRRGWAAVMTVGIAVAMVVTITGANGNLIDSATRTFSSVAKTNLYVSSTPADQSPTGPILPANLQSTLASVPGVTRVVEGQWAYATVGNTRVTIQGLAIGTHTAISGAMSDDVRARVLAGLGVVLSRDLARSLRVSRGDELQLSTPHGVHSVQVLEVVPYFSALEGAIAINLSQLQEWFDRPGANYFELTVSPAAPLDQIQAAVGKALPTSAYLYTGAQALDGMSGAVKQGATLVAGLQWIVALVAAVALLNTLTLSVIERRRELGVLRAMGSSRKLTLQMVLAEAGGIGIVGGAIGMVLGSVAHYLDAMVFGKITTIDIFYEPSPLALGFAAAALSLSLLGSIPPAVRASRLNIVKAISVE